VKFTTLEIPDVILCQSYFFGDDLGYFSETLRQDKLDAFLVLSNEAILSYKVDNIYSPDSDREILFNKKELNIDWSLILI
jgi:dTDP-4-dehydrorhamnose 3,5-epimerase-like enzyme